MQDLFELNSHNVGDQALTLGWEIMELAKPLLPYFSQHLLIRSSSHISLKKTTCCVRIPAAP
jgi:hypothetical protein